MKAIQTYYDNHLFRSRLEARHAVFLNALGIPYEYEPEGFTDGKVSYLPDFYLRDRNCYLEIKGIMPDFDDQEKILTFAKTNEIYVAVGQILPPNRGSWERGGWMLYACNDDQLDFPVFLSQPYCWQLLPEGGYGILPLHERVEDFYSSRLERAYKVATTAQFEHKNRQVA